ncbi:MAG: hypothetical protein ACRYGK_10440 [Janthinobacterium lividum]
MNAAAQFLVKPVKNFKLIGIAKTETQGFDFNQLKSPSDAIEFLSVLKTLSENFVLLDSRFQSESVLSKVMRFPRLR